MEFGVSVRTVKRDLDSLERAGLPIWSRPGPGGGYGVIPESVLPPVTLAPAEAMALLAAVTASPDAPYSDLAAAGIRKIMDVLDPVTRTKAAGLADRVWVDAGETAPRHVWSSLEQGMTDQKAVRIRFTTLQGVVSLRDVEPVIFAKSKGAWYLIAWCRTREAIRWFAVERISEARVTGMPCSEHSIEEIGTPPARARSASPTRTP